VSEPPGFARPRKQSVVEAAVKDLILKMSMSLDGFVSDHEGRNAWMFGDDQEAKAFVVETIADASLHIMGSRSFQQMAAYWPAAPGPFAAPMNDIPKVVFSRSTPPSSHAEDGSWAHPFVVRGDLAREIARLKAGDGRPLLAHGGVHLARALVAAGLVDRLVLLVHPVALGDGHPLFSDLGTPLRLELLSTRAFPGGAVAMIYRPR